jgi:hypothetical protein
VSQSPDFRGAIRGEPVPIGGRADPEVPLTQGLCFYPGLGSPQGWGPPVRCSTCRDLRRQEGSSLLTEESYFQKARSILRVAFPAKQETRSVPERSRTNSTGSLGPTPRELSKRLQGPTVNEAFRGNQEPLRGARRRLSLGRHEGSFYPGSRESYFLKARSIPQDASSRFEKAWPILGPCSPQARPTSTSSPEFPPGPPPAGQAQLRISSGDLRAVTMADPWLPVFPAASPGALVAEVVSGCVRGSAERLDAGQSSASRHQGRPW